jgi:putative flippase GtrA
MENPIRKILEQRIHIKFLGFLLSGLPAFLVAIPLNYFLVEFLHLYKPLAYVLVLILQVSVNFLILRRFVFNTSKEDPILKQYVVFLGGIGLVRLLDLVCYTLFVEVFGFYYLGVQLANVVIFSVVKFMFSRSVLEKKKVTQN